MMSSSMCSMSGLNEPAYHKSGQPITDYSHATLHTVAVLYCTVWKQAHNHSLNDVAVHY